jgi:hypothetical protein
LVVFADVVILLALVVAVAMRSAQIRSVRLGRALRPAARAAVMPMLLEFD